ncbi:MAG: hypothetical protein R2827_03785 [Bdellovibrionales bacterium]
MKLDMNGMMGNVQNQMKSSTLQIFTLSLKVFTGFMLGLTLTLIGQETFSYGVFFVYFCHYFYPVRCF